MIYFIFYIKNNTIYFIFCIKGLEFYIKDSTIYIESSIYFINPCRYIVKIVFCYIL